MKSRIAFAVFAILLLVLAGCAPKSTPTPPATAAPVKQVSIAVLIPVLGNSYNEAIVNGVKDTAAKMGATVAVYSSEYDATRQVQQIQDAVTSGKFDAFIINPVDAMTIYPEVQDAAKAGIKIGSVDGIIGPNIDSLDPVDGINVAVAVTGLAQGVAFGEKTVEACANKNPCKVVYLIGIQQGTGDQERLKGFHSVIDKHPEITVVAEQEAQYLQDKGFNVMQNILQSHPDIDVVTTAGDQMSMGAAQAAADAGLAGKIVILGNGASVEGVKAIQGGTLSSSFALLPYTEGQVVAEWVIRAARGETVKKGIDMSKIGDPLPSTGPWIDKNSANTFKAQW